MQARICELEAQQAMASLNPDAHAPVDISESMVEEWFEPDAMSVKPPSSAASSVIAAVDARARPLPVMLFSPW